MAQSVESEIIIKLPLNKCWEKMRDLTLAVNYIPDIYRIVMDTQNKEGVGVRRTAFRPAWPWWSHETVVKWVPNSKITLKLQKGKNRTFFYMNSLYFNYEIIEDGPRTRFKPSIDFIPRWSFTEKLIEKELTKLLEVICIAMKEYYETNVPISPHRMDEIRKQADINVNKSMSSKSP